MNFSKDSLDVTLRDEVEISQEQGNPRFLLTAWEKWMVEKEKKDREKRRYLLQKKREDELMRYEKMIKEKERKQKASASHKLWLAEKEKQIKIEKQEREKKLREETVSAQKKDETIKQKNTESFQRWVKLKQEEKMRQLKREKEQKEAKRTEQFKKQEQAEEAYKQWLQDHQRRKMYWWRQQDNMTNHSYPITDWIGPLDDDHPNYSMYEKTNFN